VNRIALNRTSHIIPSSIKRSNHRTTPNQPMLEINEKKLCACATTRTKKCNGKATPSPYHRRDDRPFQKVSSFAFFIARAERRLVTLQNPNIQGVLRKEKTVQLPLSSRQ
jgi:hypothetical protein